MIIPHSCPHGRTRSAPAESQANFVWLPLGDRALEFAEHALENKVVVRAFAGSGVRVSAGTPEDVDLFLAAAGSFPR